MALNAGPVVVEVWRWEKAAVAELDCSPAAPARLSTTIEAAINLLHVAGCWGGTMGVSCLLLLYPVPLLLLRDKILEEQELQKCREAQLLLILEACDGGMLGSGIRVSTAEAAPKPSVV